MSEHTLDIGACDTDGDYEGQYSRLEFRVDGEKIAQGYIGGEQEDNSRGRDYGW